MNGDFEIDGERTVTHDRLEQAGSLGESGSDFSYFELRNEILHGISSRKCIYALTSLGEHCE